VLGGGFIQSAVAAARLPYAQCARAASPQARPEART
jgi:hypothetical protein